MAHRAGWPIEQEVTLGKLSHAKVSIILNHKNKFHTEQFGNYEWVFVI